MDGALACLILCGLEQVGRALVVLDCLEVVCVGAEDFPQLVVGSAPPNLSTMNFVHAGADVAAVVVDDKGAREIKDAPHDFDRRLCVLRLFKAVRSKPGGEEGKNGGRWRRRAEREWGRGVASGARVRGGEARQ